MTPPDLSDSSYVPPSGLDKTTLTERVYATLKEDILANRLLPDTPLQEASIARALDVSRGPVREALRKLAAEGLVSLRPRRGAVVSSLTPEEFLDAYRVREALEVLAIRLATSRLEQDDLGQLESLNEEMLQAAEQEDVESFFRANADFHALLVDRSENPFLRDIYYPLMDQMQRYRLRSVNLRGGLKRSCGEHETILEALRRRDAEQAGRLLSEHIQEPQRILESAAGADELELALRSSPDGMEGGDASATAG